MNSLIQNILLISVLLLAILIMILIGKLSGYFFNTKKKPKFEFTRDLRKRLVTFTIYFKKMCDDNKQIFNKKREQMKSWEFQHPIFVAIVIYFSIFLITISICKDIFTLFNLWKTNIENARVVLSTLAQGQFAVITLLISLNLIIIQLSTTTYSPRVAEEYKKNPDFWILLSIYFISIAYNLILLNGLSADSQNIVSSSPFLFSFFALNVAVSFGIWLGIFSVLAMIPYILSLIKILNKDFIIENLTFKLSEKVLLDDNDDSLQKIFDIIHGSIKIYDITTFRSSIKPLISKISEILNSCDRKNEYKLSSSFCEYLMRSGRLSIHLGDEETTGEIISCIADLGRKTVKHGEISIIQALYSMTHVTLCSAEKRFIHATCVGAMKIGELGFESAKNCHYESLYIFAEMNNSLAREALESKIFNAIPYLARNFEGIGVESVKNKVPQEFINPFITEMYRFCDHLEKERFVFYYLEFINSVSEIGFELAENNYSDSTIRIGKLLEKMGILAIKNKRENEFIPIYKNLEIMAQICADKNNQKPFENILENLERMAIEFGNNEYRSDMECVILSIRAIGENVFEKNLIALKNTTIHSLLRLGLYAMKHQLEPVEKDVKLSLSQLSRIDESCVRIGITEKISGCKEIIELSPKYQDEMNSQIGYYTTLHDNLNKT